jgi:argonaute-like protein implicated in RNA metabolism and viral defense
VTPDNAGRPTYIDNPFVGDWTGFSDSEAYLCTTGAPFRIPGTANPLHIRRAYGDMPIEQCAADVFALSCLTWPRPEGAMRLPITIKLCDRTLFDEAADYDEDAVEFEGAAESIP